MTDYRGRALAGSGELSSFENEPWINRVMNSHTVIETDAAFLTVAVPVKCGGRTEAAIVVRYSLSGFLDSLVVGTDSTGRSFQHLDSIVATSDGSPLTVGGSFAAPSGWLMATAPIRALPKLQVAVLESEAVALRAASTVATALAGIAVLLTVGMLFAIWWISRMVTNPIGELLSQIWRVRETGDLSSSVAPTGGVLEFQQLGTQFNQMLSQLQQTTVSADRFRQAQLSSVAAEQKMRMTIEAAPCGMLLVDSAGQIVMTNAWLETIFGYEDGELLGTLIECLVPNNFELSDGSDREAYFKQPVARPMGKDRLLEGLRKDGERFPVQVGLSPLLIDSTQHVLATIIDVTERKAVVDRLLASEERLAMSTNGTSDGLWDWNGITNEVWYSQRYRELFGFTDESEFPSHLDSFTTRVHPDDAELLFNAIELHRELGTPFDVEHRARLKDGTYRWFRSRGTASEDADGNPTRMAGSIQDIESIVAYRRALEASNSELEQFAYVSSHDLQEPLRKVASFCEILNEEYGDKLEGDGQVYIRYITDGARRMQSLVRDLLLFSRIQSQPEPLKPTKIQDCLDAAVANLDGAIEESKATIAHGKLPSVIADPRQLTQLLQNLVGNGIKYRGTKTPMIEIGVREDGPKYIISVADNGIGIAEEYQEQIFGIFRRLHTREEYSGTGIGLAICKRIIDRWEEEIWVESAEGEGSTFYFTIRKTAVGEPDV